MKKALIIGGTSGIGRSLAEILVAKNYKVAITGRRENLLDEIKASNPESFFTVNMDVKNTSIINQLLDKVTTDMGGLDLVIICSGTGDINTQLDFEIEKDTIDTNVSGFTAVADWAFNYFLNQKHGHLAAITSIGGLRGNSQAPSYSATKAYQINYTEGLRIKARKSELPLIITDIRPGFIDTQMAKGEGLFWIAPVDKAASQIFSAIIKNKEKVYITKRWQLIAFIFKILPDFIVNKL